MTKRIIHFSIGIVIFLPMVACVQELSVPEGPGEHTISLALEGSLQSYDDGQDTKAAANLAWKAGDIIYVRVETSSGANTSYAKYNSDGSWTFNYTGSLNASSKVQCCFIEKPRGTDAYQVSLSYASAIYEDPAATLTIEGSSAKLSTYLKPKTGRISFHGDSKAIKVTGLSWYSAFDLESFSFTETLNAYVNSFQASTTNYFHGFFDSENANREIFLTSENLIFKRSFGTQVLRAGASGYVDVPTHTDYEAKGWTLTNEEELIRYQPIQFEDVNFKSWLIQQGYDKDGDGEISYAEGEKVVEIVNEGNTTVASLKGIEHFPNLRRLRWIGANHWEDTYVSDGKITSVDVSNNLKLEELYLDDNQLTALDVSHNPVIKRLSFLGNHIPASGFTGSASLVHLNCSRNQLSSLDLSGFPLLEELWCTYNELTSLNVNVCPKLRRLYAYENQLSALDISSLTTLQWLEVSNNKLTALDVSACHHLEGLYFGLNSGISSIDLHNCPNLRTLVFYDTAITHIDFSICPKLSYISCSGCNMTSLDVSSLKELYSLYCGNSGLTTLNVTYNSQLRYLSCYGNDLGELDLSNCQDMYQLEVGNCGLTSLELWNLSNLEYLSCSNNDFSVFGLDVSTNSKLRDLNCGGCHLSSLDLSANVKLETLHCWSNELTELNLYANSNLSFLNTSSNPDLATIIVKTGHTFPNGLYYDSTTEIVYQD